jgi:predicted DNA-binding transcriptional regulator AlpA
VANIRVQEAAKHTGLSKSTLDKLRVFGGGPHYLKIGRAVVYSTDDLDAWLASKRRSSTWGANDGHLRVFAPKSGGQHAASFRPEISEEITLAAIAALEGKSRVVHH